MNWDAVGAIGEVIGATGVIVTFAYLAVQIGQNTVSLKASTMQTMLDASAGLHDLCASDPHLGQTGAMDWWQTKKKRFNSGFVKWASKEIEQKSA